MPGDSMGICSKDLEPTISIAASSDIAESGSRADSRPALKRSIWAILPVRPDGTIPRTNREDLDPTVDATDHHGRIQASEITQLRPVTEVPVWDGLRYV